MTLLSLRSLRSQRLGDVLAPLVAGFFGLVLWELFARLGHVEPYLLPRPLEVFAAARENAGALFGASWTTASTALVGFLMSAVVGTLIGVLLASARWLERGLYPYALVLQTVPIVAIAPLLVLWFGVGAKAVTASAFIVSLFPVIASALSGFRSVDPALRDLFRLYGASRLARLWKLELPSAVPFLATGLRVSCGLSVIGAIVGEFVAGYAEGSPGLGILVMSSYRQLRTDLMFATVACSALLGLMMFGAVSLGSFLLLRRWHASAR